MLSDTASQMIQNITGNLPEDWLLEAVAADVTEELCARLHQKEIPAGMERAAVKVMVGEYLKRAEGLGLSQNEDDAQVTSVSMGDTAISYDNTNSQKSRYAALIDSYCSAADQLIPKFRRVII